MISFYLISGFLVILVSILIAVSMPFSRLIQTIMACSISVSAFLIYIYVGSFQQLHQLQIDEEQKEKVAQLLQTMDGKQGLINKLKERIEHEPNSAQGHYLLAKLLASEGDWKESIKYFKKAKLIEPTNTNYQIQYVFALWQMNKTQFNDEIRTNLKQLIEQEPEQVDALNMLAMDAYQQQNYKQAILYWQRLLKLAPPNSNDAKMIEAAINKVKENID